MLLLLLLLLLADGYEGVEGYYCLIRMVSRDMTFPSDEQQLTRLSSGLVLRSPGGVFSL